MKNIYAFSIRFYTLIFSTFFLTACNNTTAPNSATTEKKTIASDCLQDNFVQKLDFTKATTQNIQQNILLNGTVQANPDKVVHFESIVFGIVTKTFFSLGDKVQKGQVLAELRSAELSDLQSQLKTLEAQYKVAQVAYEATASMFEDGVASQKELTEKESALDILKAEQEKIKSNLQLYSASAEKGVFQIKAPSSGIIIDKNIAPGMQIGDASEALFTIADLSEVWVMANIYASNIRHIEENMPVEIKSLSYPDQIFKGKINAIGQILDDDAKVLKAKVVLNNADGKLKPGMLMDINVQRMRSTQALAVPTEALIFDNNTNYILVYKDACNIRLESIELIAQNNNISYFAGDVKEEEKIISKNQLLIYEQVKNF